MQIEKDFSVQSAGKSDRYTHHGNYRNKHQNIITLELKSMKKLIDGWMGISLVKRILVGLILGVVLGLLFPQATGIAVLGDAFVGALKAIAPLLVFLL